MNTQVFPSKKQIFNLKYEWWLSLPCLEDNKIPGNPEIIQVMIWKETDVPKEQ